jgi:hypothetical protein
MFSICPVQHIFCHKQFLYALKNKIMRKTADNLCSPEGKAFYNYYFCSAMSQPFCMKHQGENILTG